MGAVTNTQWQGLVIHKNNEGVSLLSWQERPLQHLSLTELSTRHWSEQHRLHFYLIPSFYQVSSLNRFCIVLYVYVPRCNSRAQTNFQLEHSTSLISPVSFVTLLFGGRFTEAKQNTVLKVKWLRVIVQFRKQG